VGLSLLGFDSGIGLGICTSMDGSLVMDNLTPEQKAEQVYKSGDMIANPYPTGSLEYHRFINRLLELTSGEGE